jgi:diacylglycerol kinase (ATP)
MSEPVTPIPEREDELSKRRGFIGSVIYAMNGLLRTLNGQRNMKIHWVSGLAVMLVGMALELNIATRASVIFCVFVVLCMEVLNSALEAFVDLHIKQYARQAMVAKDAAAAAVLVLAGGAVVVFADVLFHQWRVVARSGPAIVRTIALGVPLLALTGAILAVKRSIPLLIVLGAAALALLTVLAWYSRDEVFSSCGLVFVLGALFARYRQPRI